MPWSSTTPGAKYDVFLSFRGEDTRANFTSHLYKALCGKQIEIFIDEELRGGEEISPTLQKAIEESQISIIVFSKSYASSRWCLEELAKIIECKNKYGQIVIPIFYGVDPSNVRNQTKTFGDAFAKHEQHFQKRFINTWRTALTEAANLSGWDSHVITPESLLIEKIVEDVLRRLNDMSSSDNNDLIGMDSRIKEVESLLCIGSKDVRVRVVGLWGMGGIGKTTLADAVFNKISTQFEDSYFIHKVREESEQSGGLNHLRQEFLSTILGNTNVNIGISGIGRRTFTKNRLGRKKLLIVFDDVTNFSQIEFLIGDLDSLGFGSRIIITTRDKQVLKNCKVDQIFEVEELVHDGALKLFCRYAFGQNYPTIDYMELSNRLVTYTGGVAIALKILGSALLDKRKEVWASAINKLEKISNKDIQNVLKISYDDLDDETQKIFLDIACFFKGRDIGLVKDFLNASGLFTEIGISTLIEKSLIVILNKTITMHDLLQAMGREIIRQECIEDPGKRSRLWHHNDIYDVLTKNTGTETIEGISLDMFKIRDIYLNSRSFAKMHKLRFLEFYSSPYGETKNKVHVFQSLESCFTELRYVHWHGCSFKSLLSNFHAENLVTLDMPYSNMEQLWNGVQHLHKLKKINLSCSKYLTSCPNLSGAPNLESLILQGCTSLLEIDSSIQYLNKLNHLNLSDCRSLRGIPSCINLKSLRELFLSRCSNLKTLPEIPCQVEELFLDETVIEELPSSIACLCKLVVLDLQSCSMLKSLPPRICKMKSLEHLYLSGCTKLDRLPDDIGSLESLKELYAEDTAIREMPPSMTCLNNLERFSLEKCKGRESVALSVPPLIGFHSLMSLNLTDCGIMKIPDTLGCLSLLENLYLRGNNFKSIPTSIIKLSNLSYVDISYCKRLQFLPELPLISIDAYNCTSLKALSCLSILDRTLSSDQPFIFVNFINCLELQRNVLNSIMEDVLLKLQHLASLWHHHKVAPRASICFSGSEIPEWFNFQNSGSIITVELSPSWFNKNFVGFALCAVVAIGDHHQANGLGLAIACEFKLKSEDGHSHIAYGTLDDWATSLLGLHYIRSDHVFMGFDFTLYPGNVGELYHNNKAYFQFHILGGCLQGMECCKVKKCGVRLMYT